MDDLDSNPAVQRRRLREALQNARSGKQLTQAEVSRSLGWSASKLLRIENGKHSVSATDLSRLLSLYGITDPAQARELTAAAKVAARVSRPPAAAGITPGFRNYLEYERSAARIKCFEPLLVPGLAQTPEYAFAIIRGLSKPEDSDDEVNQRVAIRSQRQRELAERAPQIHLLLDEAAIHRHIGGREVMAGQLGWLKELNRRSNVTVQVVPFSLGVHAGLCGPFILLEFDDDEAPVLYKENGLTDDLHRSDAAQIRTYAENFDMLAANATPAGWLDRILDDAVGAMTPFRVAPTRPVT